MTTKRNNLTRRDLSQAINDKMGFSKSSSRELVDNAFDVIKAALLKGEAVKLVNFGAFAVRDKVPRVGRNPKTGENIEIKKRQTVTFKPSRQLRAKVNK